MNYEEALAFIHSIERFGTKPGLRRVRTLLERMGNPQEKLRFVHVAGTNGKGSTCTMLSHILVQAGYKTGLYISPFVLDFRERIQVDNAMIEPEALAACTAYVKGFWDELDAIGETPSEFEVVVAVAMEYFVRSGCDIVVLEVGLGGRWDATNVIATPLVSVLTRIDMDHMQYLGDTLEKIAYEKCGIIKEGGATVCYPRQEAEVLAVVMERCAEMDNRLLTPGIPEVLSEDIGGSRVRWGELELTIPLAGRHQVLNTATVLETVEELRRKGLAISGGDIVQGIAFTRFPARMERICDDPLILLDGGHNLDGAKALAETLHFFRDRRIHLVFGMMADKDVAGWVEQILPLCATATATTVSGQPRAMPAGELAQHAAGHCGQVSSLGSPAAAIAHALSLLQGDDVLLVCGSLFLAAEARPILLQAVENGINRG